MLQRIGHTVHHGRGSREKPVINGWLWRTAAVRWMGRADRNSDRFSAGDTDFAQMIAGANVRNDSFDALASSGMLDLWSHREGQA